MNADTLRGMFEGVDPKWTAVISGGCRRELLSTALNALYADVGGDMSLLAPEPRDIFRAFRVCPWDSFRVLIIGQDPYPAKGDADGMAFSSRAASHPKSLSAVFRCLKMQNLINDTPAVSTLDSWALQGVLLLNATLTTRVGTSKAHVKIWDKYTDALIKATVEAHPHVVIMLWGNDAQSKGSVVEHPHVYTWGHPSPLNAANRKIDNPANFLHCDNFRKCNEDLTSRGLAPIDWNSVNRGAQPEILVGTDGGSRGNGKPDCRASWAFCVYQNGNIATRQSGLVDATAESPATNNRGELVAMLQAVYCLVEAKTTASRVTIISDSEYCINTVDEWAPKWFADPAKLEGKKNIDLIRRIVDGLAVLRRDNTVVFEHINSHVDAPPVGTTAHIKWMLNDTCDRMCTSALT